MKLILPKKGQEEEIAIPTLHISPKKEDLKRRKVSGPSQKTPPQRMSPRKGRPEEKEGLFPSDPSPKDPESETAYQYAATAVSPNAKYQGSEAPLYSIDYTGKPPSNPAQSLQELHCEELASQQPFLDFIPPK
jgi:hypothetical protein